MLLAGGDLTGGVRHCSLSRSTVAQEEQEEQQQGVLLASGSGGVEDALSAALSRSCDALADGVTLQSTKAFGRTLVARRCIAAGEELVVAPPELSVTVPAPQPDAPPGEAAPPAAAAYQRMVSICEEACSTFGCVFYWAALAALVVADGPALAGEGRAWALPPPISEEAQARLLQLFWPSAISSKCRGRMDNGQDAAVVRIVSEFGLQCPPQKFEHLLLVLKYNSFASSSCVELEGLILFFAPSFCNHSCRPSCKWRLDDDGRFVLVALPPGLTEGEVISISYLSNEELNGTTLERREGLARGWVFFCGCERCALSRAPACQCCGGLHHILLSEKDESPYGECNVDCDDCGSVDLACEHAYFGHCFECGRDLCPRCMDGAAFSPDVAT